METEMNPMTTEMKSIENKDKNNLGVVIEKKLIYYYYFIYSYFTFVLLPF